MGYVREIHRDSDARHVVFLLYLNDFPEKGEGGELNLFEYTGKRKHEPGPQTSSRELCANENDYTNKRKIGHI